MATVRKLALNTTYTFRIRAELPGGSFSDWVESAPFLTGKIPTAATQIAPPTNLTVARNDYRGILVTWDDNTANESAHILSISGPGLPAGGVEMNVEHLLSGSKTLPLDYPFVGAYRLQHDMTYSAKVKCRGGKQTKPANTFDTDWTAEEAFTTVAPHIAIVNLPVPEDEPLILLRGQPFSFRVATNISATLVSIVDGQLPNGLSFEGDTISGSTTDPEGIYDATIKAEDALTSDTQPFRLVLQTPPFRFTTLPTSLTAWIGVPFLFHLPTNTLSTSLVLTSGSLPAGLVFDGESIAGTATAPEGAYPASFRAENELTSATGDLLISVQAPGIRVLVKPQGASARPQPGPDWGEVVVPLAALFPWEVSAEPIGPINIGNTVTIENAPAWLALNATSLIGTPDTSGVTDVLIKWGNGTITGETELRIQVKSVQITSADELTVLQDEAFQFQLTAQPAAHFSTQDDLPMGIAIVSPEVGDSFLRGATRELGDYSFRLIATLGHEQDTQEFALHVKPLIVLGDDASEVRGWQGDALIEMLSYRGVGTVVHWFLSGAPPGVEIGSLNCPGGPYQDGNLSVVAITGAPSAAGIFDGVITAQVSLNGIPRLYRRSVRFLISGGLFLNWFHNDPARRDLQVLLRTREVRSYSFSGEQGLWLKRGDQMKLHVIFRDGPLSLGSDSASGGGGGSSGAGGSNNGGVVVVIGSNNNTPSTPQAGASGATGTSFGRNIVADGFTTLRLVIRPQTDPEEILLLDLGGEVVAETIEGNVVFAFDFTVTSDELEAAIEREGHRSAEPPASVSLACVGELTWLRESRGESSRNFPITITQDLER